MQHNISLLPYNTFGIDVIADSFIEVVDIDMLPYISELPGQKYVLGGGSNILLTQPVSGLVLLNRLKGIEVLKEDDANVWLTVSSGEVWHQLVMYAVNKGLGGLENLALIPGTVGASPMQNIGAYGVEAKEVIESVTFWQWHERKLITYQNSDCHFGYRDSIFKHELKDKVFITSVVYKLTKKPIFNTSYGAIEQELAQMKVPEPSVAAIAQAVINIRSSKLPDPRQIGNAGSFFKNPTILLSEYNLLKDNFPGIPSYPVSETTVKVPAGWLIEQCGWKGYRKGDIGVHDKQALVLVNHGEARGSDIWQLSGDIVESVKQRYGIELEREVQVW